MTRSGELHLEEEVAVGNVIVEAVDGKDVTTGTQSRHVLGEVDSLALANVSGATVRRGG